MFPDEESVWEGYPSIIDGIRYPHVILLGVLGNTIHFIVSGEEIEPEGFAVSADVHLYWVADELDVSVTGHGLPSLAYAYPKGSYVKRAVSSRLLDAYRQNDILSANYRNAMHFAFLGGDDCIEFVTTSDPHIAPLQSKADWNSWVRSVTQEIADTFRAQDS